jgi:hypothetical protein
MLPLRQAAEGPFQRFSACFAVPVALEAELSRKTAIDRAPEGPFGAAVCLRTLHFLARALAPDTGLTTARQGVNTDWCGLPVGFKPPIRPIAWPITQGVCRAQET